MSPVRFVKHLPRTLIITPPGGSYPVSLGDISAGGSASAAFTINFSSCNPSARFALTVPWSSATYETGTFLWPAADQNNGGNEDSNEHSLNPSTSVPGKHFPALLDTCQ